MTPEEISRKRNDAREQGKTVAVVSHFTCQHLSKAAVEALLMKKAEIIELIVQLNGGEEFDDQQLLFRLDGDVHLKLDGSNCCAHLRRYWFNPSSRQMCPNKRGTCISLDEMVSLIQLLEDKLYAEIQKE